MDVTVVTNVDLGWDCVVGVYLDEDMARFENQGDNYIFSNKTVDEDELILDNNNYDDEELKFDESIHCEIADGGFQETEYGDYSTRIKYTRESYVKYTEVLSKFKSKNEELSHLKFGIAWNEVFGYCYPVCLNESSLDIVDNVIDEVMEYLNSNDLYFY